MSERVKRRVGKSQQAVPVDRPVLIVSSTRSQYRPQTAVERNSHLEVRSSLLIRFVAIKQMTRLGGVAHQKPGQVPGRVSAATAAEPDEAGDPAFIDQHMGRVERTVEKLADGAQVVIVGVVGKDSVDAIHSRIVKRPTRPKSRYCQIKNSSQKVNPGVKLSMHLSISKVGCFLEKPESGNSNLVHSTNGPSGFADESVAFLRLNADVGKRNTGDLFDDDEVARIGFSPKVSSKDSWRRGPELPNTLVRPRF